MSDGETAPPELENTLLEFTIKVREDARPDTETREETVEYTANALSRRPNRRDTIAGESYSPGELEDDNDIQIIPKSASEMERIKILAESVYSFRKLDTEDLDAVIDAMVKLPVEKGQVIIEEGEDGDIFYVIHSGIFHVYKKDKNGEDKYDRMYENDGFFGELALLHGHCRTETVKADTGGLLWAIDRKTFNKVIIQRAFQTKKLYMKLLEAVDQLKHLTEYEKMKIADALVAKFFSEDGVIVKEGDEYDGMYFIVRGKVDVVKQKEEEIARLGVGDFFGELALVRHQPRAATVIAREDTTVAFLKVKTFLSAC